jgi:hypothetical protein
MLWTESGQNRLITNAVVNARADLQAAVSIFAGDSLD